MLNIYQHINKRLKMGVIFQFAVFSFSIIAILVAINRAKQGNVPTIRPITCLDALDELIGRSAEMGTPVHFITGAGSMTGSEAPIVAAGFAILGYVAELCGKYQVPLRYTCMYGYTVPIAQDLIQGGYTKGGHPELYNDDMVYYVGETQNAIEADSRGAMTALVVCHDCAWAGTNVVVEFMPSDEVDLNPEIHAMPATAFEVNIDVKS